MTLLVLSSSLPLLSHLICSLQYLLWSPRELWSLQTPLFVHDNKDEASKLSDLLLNVSMDHNCRFAKRLPSPAYPIKSTPSGEDNLIQKDKRKWYFWHTWETLIPPCSRWLRYTGAQSTTIGREDWKQFQSKYWFSPVPFIIALVDCLHISSMRKTRNASLGSGIATQTAAACIVGWTTSLIGTPAHMNKTFVQPTAV